VAVDVDVDVDVDVEVKDDEVLAGAGDSIFWMLGNSPKLSSRSSSPETQWSAPLVPKVDPASVVITDGRGEGDRAGVENDSFLANGSGLNGC